jgi:hypothetical protein
MVVKTNNKRQTMSTFKSAEIANVFAQLIETGFDPTIIMSFGKLISECEDDGSGLLEFLNAVLEQLQKSTQPLTKIGNNDLNLSSDF